MYTENGHVPTVAIQTMPDEPIIIEQPAKNCGNDADICCTPAQTPGAVENVVENIGYSVEPSNVPIAGLSPRLEMRLALNNDIMGDEDLICYDPGPDLATILGRDLSTYHRFTGRDLISRSASRVVPKEALISYCQQKNSKMDTPTPNRKKSSQSTWNNSVYVDPGTKQFFFFFLVHSEVMVCVNYRLTILFIILRQRKKTNRPRTISDARDEVLQVSIEEWSSSNSVYKSNEEYESCRSEEKL